VAEKAARQAGDVNIASVYKRRSPEKVGHVEALDVMGDVKGRMCVLIDDEIDTAGTVCEAAKLLYQKGATDVWVMGTHGVFSEPAVDRIKNSNISRVIVTDTVPLPPEKQLENLDSVSVAKTFADAIRAVFEEGSVSELFGGDNQN
jgi:ribose-phosphate pyrophosphokinase